MGRFRRLANAPQDKPCLCPVKKPGHTGKQNKRGIDQNIMREKEFANHGQLTEQGQGQLVHSGQGKTFIVQSQKGGKSYPENSQSQAACHLVGHKRKGQQAKNSCHGNP